MEDALHDLESKCRIAGLRLSERISDETTILNFRQFLEKRGLGGSRPAFRNVGQIDRLPCS